jgi:outer membrane protein OmpA-like peptidoglycan-associated protein
LKKIISTLALVVLFCSFTFAIDFNGLIKDELTSIPVEGAMVRVFKNNDQIASVKTNEEGRFSIPLLMGFDYKVYIDKTSYEQLRVNVSTNFSSSITELPFLDLRLVKTKEKLSSPPIAVNLVGKLYHLQLGGLEAEQINVKNNLTGEMQTTTTLSNGNYSVQIAPNSNYTITINTNGSYPEYAYAPIYLNTTGIDTSIQIIRNFENKGLIIETEVKSPILLPTSNIEKKEQTTTIIPNKASSHNVIRDTSTNKSKAEVIKDKDKALLKSLHIKYEKLLAADSLNGIKDKMVARNMVVKFYDEEKNPDTKTNKISSRERSIPATKAILRNSDTLQSNKSTETKKDVPTFNDTSSNKKIEIPPTILNEQSSEKTFSNDDQKAIDKTATDKRIDSIIGTATRFMHRESTTSDKTKSDEVQQVKPETIDIKTDISLPVKIDEERTPVIDYKIYYAEGKAFLDTNAIGLLTMIANRLKSNPNSKVEIAVHSDLNDEASIADYICKLRIKKIVDLMINTLGVNFQQLVVRSVGINEPANNCKKGNTTCTALDHQMNRRTEIKYLN